MKSMKRKVRAQQQNKVPENVLKAFRQPRLPEGLF